MFSQDYIIKVALKNFLRSSHLVSRLTMALPKLTDRIHKMQKQLEKTKKTLHNQIQSKFNNFYSDASIFSKLTGKEDFMPIFNDAGQVDISKLNTPEGQAQYQSYQQYMTQQRTYGQALLKQALEKLDRYIEHLEMQDLEPLKDKEAEMTQDKLNAETQKENWKNVMDTAKESKQKTREIFFDRKG